MTEFVQLTQGIAYLSFALTAPVMTAITGVFVGVVFTDLRDRSRKECRA